MTRTRIAIVGAGQRVVETALPVLQRLEDEFELDGIFSRTARELRVERRVHVVEPLEALDAARCAKLDVLYLVVAKGAVPEVLERLATLEPRNTDLLIETPVLLPRHLARAGSLGAFRSASVTEDCLTLPLLDVVRACVASGQLGTPRAAILSHCAYAYHGVALLKGLLGVRRVLAARRRRLGREFALREFRFEGESRGLCLDPRDYGTGRFLVVGSQASLGDHEHRAAGHLTLHAEQESGRIVAYRAGDSRRALDAAELELLGDPRPGQGLWTQMDGLKRIGFRTLLQNLRAGHPAYPVLAALDDSLVDYHLEKVGRYYSNPLTSARGLLVGSLLRSVHPHPEDWSLPARVPV
jgi:hypothetical protein